MSWVERVEGGRQGETTYCQPCYPLKIIPQLNQRSTSSPPPPPLLPPRPLDYGLYGFPQLVCSLNADDS